MKEILYHSPVGTLKIKTTGQALLAITFLDDEINEDAIPNKSSKIAKETIAQLEDYFAGRRTDFDLPLAPEGTDFQQRVWQALQKISFGQTTTYSQLSIDLGDPKAIRAVGTANGRNPIPIIIPCHRVIGANNNLTGYAGGIERKRWLLQHEGAILL